MTTTSAQRRRVIRRLEDLAVEYRDLTGATERNKRARVKAMVAARALDPPVTIAELAGIFGVTEAGVTVTLRRAGH